MLRNSFKIRPQTVLVNKCNYHHPCVTRSASHLNAFNFSTTAPASSSSSPDASEFQQVSNVIIGGGAIGASTLYHSVLEGFDTILLEKGTMTCGSTWHAAGLVTFFHPGSGLRKFHEYSCDLYPQLEKDTGRQVSFHRPGSIRLIENNEDRIDETYFQMSKSKLYVNNGKQELITPDEIKALHPLININNNDTKIWGGIYTQNDGHIDPTGLTWAFVEGAKIKAKERNPNSNTKLIRENTAVIGLEHIKENGKWKVFTNNGTNYLADRIINCAGLFGEHVGQMAGVYHGVGYIEHQYVITDTIDKVSEYWKEHKQQLPVLRSLDGSYYIRQERDGLLIGPYEPGEAMKLVDSWNYNLMRHPSRCAPLSFGTDLFEDDLERLDDNLAHCMDLIPEFGQVGIKSVVNGPVSWSPDGSPLLGPIYDNNIKNYWCGVGMSYGIAHAGGTGKYLIDWIKNGEPSFELFECDVLRYGNWASKQYSCAKIRETYGMNNSIVYPKEERYAGRPIRTNSLYNIFKHKYGCVFGFHNGLEQPLYFDTSFDANNDNNNTTAVCPQHTASFRRCKWFDIVKNEVNMCSNSLGIMDMSTFSKLIIKGRDANKFLDRLIANRMPTKQGKICIGHMLSESGKILAELTITKLSKDEDTNSDKDEYYVVTGSDMERHDMRWMYQQMDIHNFDSNNVKIESITTDYSVLHIAGPESDIIFKSLLYAHDEDCDEFLNNFKFFTHKRISLGTEKYGSVPDVDVLKLSFTGLKGFEFHCKNEYLYSLYNNIINICDENNINYCHFGAYALDSMRMEAGFKFIGTDMRKDDTAIMANLQKFIKLKNRNFNGKEQILNDMNNGVERQLVKTKLNAIDADAYGDNPIFRQDNDELIGWTTSGAYSFQSNQSLAWSYLYNGYENNEYDMYVEIVGEKIPIKVIGQENEKEKEKEQSKGKGKTKEKKAR